MSEMIAIDELVHSLTLACGEKIIAERVAYAVETYVDARLERLQEQVIDPLEEIVCRLEGR
jgi:acyl-CoA reductase-like NAD-dependent aldehyde dehydrogenase